MEEQDRGPTTALSDLAHLPTEHAGQPYRDPAEQETETSELPEMHELDDAETTLHPDAPPPMPYVPRPPVAYGAAPPSPTPYITAAGATAVPPYAAPTTVPPYAAPTAVPPYAAAPGTATPPYAAATGTATPPYAAATGTATPPYAAAPGTATPPYAAAPGTATPPYAAATGSATPPYAGTAVPPHTGSTAVSPYAAAAGVTAMPAYAAAGPTSATHAMHAMPAYASPPHDAHAGYHAPAEGTQPPATIRVASGGGSRWIVIAVIALIVSAIGVVLAMTV
ncbi:MAG: hypothetical protein KF773_00575 [Deltaproteobacteria bacterium]|nr:hypothetical protein [Deltaproteobacteria bacterium]